MLNDTEFESNFDVRGFVDGNVNNMDNFDIFANEYLWNFFEDLEDEYDCAGVCYVPLFYLTKPIRMEDLCERPQNSSSLIRSLSETVTSLNQSQISRL